MQNVAPTESWRVSYLAIGPPREYWINFTYSMITLLSQYLMPLNGTKKANWRPEFPTSQKLLCTFDCK